MTFESPPEKQTKPGKYLSKPGFLLPAVQALAIQIAALILLYALLQVVWFSFGLQVTIVVAALVQGSIATLLSYWRRLPIWWLLIQLSFPIALLITISLELPPSLFLGAFLMLVVVYWTPFKTRVPLYLSSQPLWEKVSNLLPKDEGFSFIDIGSGLGGLVLYLARKYPNAAVCGVELAPFPWFVSWLRGCVADNNARFILGNYNKFDLSQFDVVFAYLSPAAMDSLWKKALLEMRPGALLLSYEFPILEAKPDIVIQHETGGSILYGWRIANISHK